MIEIVSKNIKFLPFPLQKSEFGSLLKNEFHNIQKTREPEQLDPSPFGFVWKDNHNPSFQNHASQSIQNNWQPPSALHDTSYLSLKGYFEQNDVEVIGFSEQYKIYIVAKKGSAPDLIQGQKDYFQALFSSGMSNQIFPNECERSQMPLVLRIYDARKPEEDAVPMSLEVDGIQPDLNKFETGESDGYDPKAEYFFYTKGYDYIPLTNKATVYRDFKSANLTCSSAADTQQHELKHWFQAEQLRHLTRNNTFQDWCVEEDEKVDGQGFFDAAQVFENGNSKIGYRLSVYAYPKDVRFVGVIDADDNGVQDYEDEAANAERLFQEYRAGTPGQKAQHVISRPSYDVQQLRTDLSDNYLEGIPFNDLDRSYRDRDK